MPKKIDLTGQRFGRLMVIEDSGKRKCHSVVWLCKCDCGNITKITQNRLSKGTTKSCGCLLRDECSKRISPSKKNVTKYYKNTQIAALKSAKIPKHRRM